MYALVTMVWSRSRESQCAAVSSAPAVLSAQGAPCGPSPAEMGAIELFEISVCIPEWRWAISTDVKK